MTKNMQNDTRGRVNARQNQTTTQPESPALAAIGDGDAAAKIAHLPPAKGKRMGMFAQHQTIVSETVANKIATTQTVRQRLAEAYDLFREGGEKAEEGRKIADEASVSLYQGRATGALSTEEVSGLLGDIFGYKPKADGSPGKTPDGQGEAIRKRVVRAAQAKQHLLTGDGGSFFEGLDGKSETNPEGKFGVQSFEDVMNKLDRGDVSIWTVYDVIGDIRNHNREGVPAAFNPKTIAKIVEGLTDDVDAAATAIGSNPGLVTAYAALMDALRVIDEAGAEPVRKAA